MGNLNAFLHPAEEIKEKEIIISKRFLDENGNPVPFKIRALTQEENEQVANAATHPVKTRFQQVEKKLDNLEYMQRMVVAATVEPRFDSPEMCDAYGTMNPLEVPGKMLLAGEYSLLLDEIMAFSGFNSDLGEEAKN